MALLDDQQQEQVRQAIAGLEQSTDAELVTVLAKQSDDYLYIPTLWAALIALLSPSLLLLSPMWLEASELVLAQLLLFMVLALLLRWPPLMFRLIPKAVRRWRAASMARRQFLEQGLHHTLNETGLLVFVSEAEHYVEIIADRGISQQVEDSEWQAIIDNFTQSLRAGNTLQGFLYCIADCGDILQRVAPATAQKNELPNHLVLLD